MSQLPQAVLLGRVLPHAQRCVRAHLRIRAPRKQWTFRHSPSPTLPNNNTTTEDNCSTEDKQPKKVGETAVNGAAKPPALDLPASARPKRSFEEDAEDEDGARLRRKHLLSVATSKDIRDALLGDDRILNAVNRIDASENAEQALDAACEDPAFRDFTEKILDTLQQSSR